MFMFYKSTRNSEVKVSSAQAIAQGISEDGGLFVPSEIPAITLDDIKALGEKSYAERALFVFSKYLTDFTEAEIRYCVEGAYNTKNFDTDNIAELAHLFDGTYMLELWHGPTCAFKDMALQILPYFLTTSVKKINLVQRKCAFADNNYKDMLIYTAGHKLSEKELKLVNKLYEVRNEAAFVEYK